MKILVLAAKIFLVAEEYDAGDVAGKLEGFRVEESHVGFDRPLATEVLDVKVEGNSVTGVLAKDYPIFRVYKGEKTQTLVTEFAPFLFIPHDERVFLIVLAPSKPRLKKLLTNHVANMLSKIIYGKTGGIVEANITSETLQRLHEANPGATKLIWFDNIDYPNVGKLALTGSALADTGLYQEYLSHGKIWYVVFEAPRGIVVGITRNCVVVAFSKMEQQSFINYITEEVLKLIS